MRPGALLLRNRIFVNEVGPATSCPHLQFRGWTGASVARRCWTAACCSRRSRLRTSTSTTASAAGPRARPWTARRRRSTSPAGVPSRRLHPRGARGGSPTRIGPGRPWPTTTCAATGRRTCGSRSSASRSRTSWPSRIEQLGSAGEVVGSFDSLGQWFRRWIREMTEGERSFVFVDSRLSAPHILPMRATPRAHHLHAAQRAPPLAAPLELPDHGGLQARAATYPRAWTRWSRSPSASATTSPCGRGAPTTCSWHPIRSRCPRMPASQRDRDPHRVAIVARLEKQKGLQ